jgi:hypothetical protein
MCPVQDDPQYHHRPLLPIAGRSHSDSTSGVEGFAIWRGRRIRKDVGSWPCDTIELEVCFPFPSYSGRLLLAKVEDRTTKLEVRC